MRPDTLVPGEELRFEDLSRPFPWLEERLVEKIRQHLQGGAGPCFCQDPADRSQFRRKCPLGELLEGQHAVLRALFQGYPEAAIALGEDGEVELWNPAAEAFLGYAANDVIGQLCPIAPLASDGSRVLPRVLDGEVLHSLEVGVRTRDGEVVPAALSSSRVPLSSGERRHVVMVLTDLRPFHALARELRQSQKMEALGRLSAALAHEFNNLFMVFTGFAEILRASLPPGGPAQGHLQHIAEASIRGGELTRQLLLFSSRRKPSLVPVELGELLLGLRDELRILVSGGGIRFDLRVEPGLRGVDGEPGLLQQIVRNLVINARDAMPGGGELTVEAWNEGDSEVTLAVRDTGCGISPEALDRIFEPFFTTKNRPGKFGLGLAIVHGGVAQLGGRIEVETRIGEGTTFRIRLPRSHHQPERPLEPLPPPAGSGEVVLLVEDDELIRFAVQQMLAELGYEVLLAESAEAALELSRSSDGPIDLLLTDVLLEGMNGAELARLMKKERFDLRILVMSGGEAPASSEFTFLPKPFSLESLGDALREALAT